MKSTIIFYLAINQATKKWTMPIRNCGVIYGQFMTLFNQKMKH